MSVLFIHIKGLAGILPASKTRLSGDEMRDMVILENAWLLSNDGLIDSFGAMDSLPDSLLTHPNIEDATGKYLLPTWCDSHTHIVFAASREEEFVLKIKGASYEEIAAAGGGILNSAEKLQHTSEGDLFNSAAERLHTMILSGTGAVEIKSGYGLSMEGELKMLRVIKRLKQSFPIPVKATFLAAHTYPASFKDNHRGYIDLIINEMLPAVAKEELADFIDVFCEKGFFSVAEMEEILIAGSKYGLRAKVHVNQLSISGAVEAAIKLNALSVDHLEETDSAAVTCIANSTAVATLLPGCSFYLGIPFANARELINAGATVALATDFNPGSSPSGNMNFVVSLGCIKLKMQPNESINAATVNGAAAMNLSENVGSITENKKANFILTKSLPSLACLPYYFGDSNIDSVYINGEKYV